MTRRTTDPKRGKVLELQAEGLTQAGIAERVGVCQKTVSRIEVAAGRGRRRRSFADAATGAASRAGATAASRLTKPSGKTER